MNSIVSIPIEALQHHPDNPRKELGDLKELIASIKESGVMQNLTVVPNPNDEETWWVVIGNRRMEASKAAGLKELPCIIADMDHKTQVATMMAENMQRVDLTLTEQAGGVQMMMDLGMDAKEISKRTGLRKDAIERRAIMAKYDTGKVAEAIVRGGTINDFLKLEQLPEEHREGMLQHIGTHNFDYYLRQKKDDIANRANIAALIAKLETFATRIERHGYVGAKVVDMVRAEYWWRVTAKQVEDFKTPADVKDVHYYYTQRNADGDIVLLKEKTGMTAEEKREEEERKRKDYVDDQREKLGLLDDALRDKRLEWICNSDKLRYNKDAILRAFVQMVSEGKCRASYDDYTKVSAETLMDIPWRDHGYASRPDLADLRKAMEMRLLPVSLAMIWAQLDNGDDNPWEYDWSKRVVRHTESVRLAILYELLEACGYEMDDEEKAYMDGTHELYRTYEEQETNHEHNNTDD